MHEAIRRLSEAVSTLFEVCDTLNPVEHQLAVTLESAAIECSGVLALVGSVEW